MSRMLMMFSCEKYRRSFISRRVLKQNMEWSNGVIFLMATFCPLGLWMAELCKVRIFRVQCSDHFVYLDSPDNTIGTFANDILNLVLFGNIERNLSRSRCWLSGARH